MVEASLENGSYLEDDKKKVFATDPYHTIHPNAMD